MSTRAPFKQRATHKWLWLQRECMRRHCRPLGCVLDRRWNSPKASCRCCSRKSVVDEVALGAAARHIRRQQRHCCRTHFRCSHSDICSFMNLSVREDNLSVADNAAACAFACATATFVSSKFWASVPAPHRSLAQNLLLTNVAVAQAKAHAAALSATFKFSSRALKLTKEQMSLWLQRKCARRRWRCWRRISLAAAPNATSSHTLSLQPQRHFAFGEFQRR